MQLELDRQSSAVTPQATLFGVSAGVTAALARTFVAMVVLLVGAVSFDARLTISGIPLNPAIFVLGVAWLATLRIDGPSLRMLAISQIAIIPLGLTLAWSIDPVYGAYKLFNLVASVAVAGLLLTTVLREFGDRVMAYCLLTFFGVLLVTAVVYKLRFGFFDRSVNFFMQGPITFARLMGIALVVSAFTLRGVWRFVAMLLFGVALVWTASKGPLLAAGIVCLAILAFKATWRTRIVVLVAGALCVLLASQLLNEELLALAQGNRLWALASFSLDALDREAGYNSFTSRYWIGISTIELIGDNPFGVGLGSWASTVSRNIGLEYPHNLLLELWAEGGLILGTLALLPFFAVLFERPSTWKICAIFLLLCQMVSGDLLDSRYILVFGLLASTSTLRSMIGNGNSMNVAPWRR